MKRLVRVTLAATVAGAIALSLVACGSSSNKGGGAATTNGAGTAANSANGGTGGASQPGGANSSDSAKALTIGFVPGIASDPFFLAMKLGAQAEADKLGVKLLWQGAANEYSPQSQLPFVNTLLAQHVDGLALVPTDPDALQPSVDKAKSLNIPVVTVDTTVTDKSYLTSAITGDSENGGKLAAQTLAEQIGDAGQVFIISGSPTATTDVLRAKGFSEELKNHPNIQLVGTEYANSQPAKATSAVNTALLKYPNLKGIFAVDGTAGTGAVAALRNSGKVGKVNLIGYDAYSTEIADLQSGVFSALIAQQPGKEAQLAIDYLVATLRGEDTSGIQKDVVLPNIVITKANYAQTKQYEYPTS
ncbi:MAG: ABC transporter substrate-binding protein [Actinomycetia bacterium]|nr:ABC transporter substrate-binding protein [Actinomycetes bacterium]